MDEGKIIPIWPEELKIYLTRHQEKDFLLVDVRQPQEYEKEHLPGAQLIPLGIIIEGRASFPGIRRSFFIAVMGCDPARLRKFVPGPVNLQNRYTV